MVKMEKWWKIGFIVAGIFLVIGLLFSTMGDGSDLWLALITLFSGGVIIHFLIGSAISYAIINKNVKQYWITYIIVFLLAAFSIPLFRFLFLGRPHYESLYGQILITLLVASGLIPFSILESHDKPHYTYAILVLFALITYTWVYLEVFSKRNAKLIKRILLIIVLVLMLIGLYNCAGSGTWSF